MKGLKKYLAFVSPLSKANFTKHPLQGPFLYP